VAGHRLIAGNLRPDINDLNAGFVVEFHGAKVSVITQFDGLMFT
jgi:hypothetical protein